ncbi:hypothetical protein MHI39_17155 [Heyndrickxia sp. FSL K6-6286]|uniref:DUF4129 domain-containing protein n=1 Tax=Heyndrickxia oleronia TaxID=38875 RepID=A0A8E2I319_9BACI|nr:hypothetical protein [Heyndrickxia oleronia]MEC1372823.1 hypothetical protein [Heyndrickxia oleronia]OOP65819.1 hypothetical protein BWZ43_24230 [Heyndrickxia oleronia]QQZ03420.1 hypothetical protein I5818_16860 [Heyndrickxia oleronia]
MESGAMQKKRINWIWIWGVLKTFISEAILLAILLFPVRLNNHVFTISWAFLIIMIGALIITFILTAGNKQRVQKLYYIISIPIMIIASLITGIPIWAMIIMVIFSQWRLYKLLPEDFDDEYFDNRNGLLLTTILVGVTMYGIGMYLEFVQNDSLLLFILLQLFLLTYGTFIKNYFQVNFKRVSPMFLMAVIIFIIPLGVAVVLTLLSGPIRLGFLSIISLIFSGVAITVGPILSKFFDLVKDNADTGYEKMKVENMNGEPTVEQGKSVIERIEPDSSIFYLIIFIAFVLFAIWAFIKFRRFQVSNEERNDGKELTIRKLFKKATNPSSEVLINPNYSKSSHQIRKSVNDLERLALKKKLGRYTSESAREWFIRIEINCTNKWIEIYEKVRYGKEEISATDVDLFLTEYKSIKAQLKEIKPSKNQDDGIHNLSE